MSEVNTIAWVAGNGAAIKIEVAEYLDSAVAYASINGMRELGSKPVMLDAPVKRGDSIVVARMGNVGLTQERLDQVRAAMDAMQANIDARPEVRMRKLIAERERLSSHVGYVMDAAHNDHVRRIERISASGFAEASRRDFSAEEQNARAALAEFDAANPEVIAKVQAEKAEATARFLDAD